MRFVGLHALRNALIPLVTYAGLQASILVGGSVLVENVFSWPGVGTLAYEAVTARKELWTAPDAGHNDLGTFGAVEAAVAFVQRAIRSD